ISLSQLACEGLAGYVDEDMLDDLGTIVECGRAARGIVSKILLFARKEATPLVACDLPAEVRRVVGFVRTLLPAGVTLRDAVPDDAVGIAAIDVGELTQVLTNLAINAG